MKKIIIFVLILFTVYSVNSQTYYSNKLSGLESSFHNNIAVLQSTNGGWYYKNTEILVSGIGKNFYDVMEIEAGIGYAGNITPYYLKTRIVLPLNDNWDYGFAANITDYTFYTTMLGKTLRRKIFRKMEISLGFTHLTKKTLNSINFNFGHMNHLNSNYNDYNAVKREFNSYTKYYSCSLTYVFSAKFNSKWGFIADNKLYLVNVDFLLPENCCNFNMFYSEQALAIRKINNNSFADFGTLLFFGIKGKETKITLIPYFSYTIAF